MKSNVFTRIVTVCSLACLGLVLQCNAASAGGYPYGHHHHKPVHFHKSPVPVYAPQAYAPLAPRFHKPPQHCAPKFLPPAPVKFRGDYGYFH